MKIVTQIHAYPPAQNAGAEWMQHAILKWLVSQGHECHVLIPTAQNYELDGVKVFQDDFDNSNREWHWADIGLTHLNRAGKAWNWAEATRTPIGYIIHNTFTNRLVEIKTNFKLIYNTEWAKEDSIKKGYKHDSFVLHPPVWFDDYHTETSISEREYITLINCWDRKGGQVLVDLARMMPERKFLGVEGGYGDQIKADLPNLTYIKNTPDIKAIYAKTRILIMPSVYESYGRTAVEALCSGIPVIASKTPGLVESLGDCGMFAPEVNDAKDLKAEPFAEFILKMDSEKAYSELYLQSINRAKEFDKRNISELKSLEKTLKKWANL